MTYELCSQVLDLATLAGKIMLESGGEVYRVEQTIAHICTMYGLPECDSYATPTTIIVSLTDDEHQTCTRVRRITRRSVNMDRVDAVNTFSRTLQTTTPTKDSLRTAYFQLEKIRHSKEYALFILTIASGLGTGCFAVIFGGGFIDFLAGCVIGAIVRLVISYFSGKKIQDFLINAIGGATCALLCWLAHAAGLPIQWLMVTLSALLLLTPGIRLTNAFRDTASGDFVAGMSLFLETISIAVALACGALLVYAPLLWQGGLTL